MELGTLFQCLGAKSDVTTGAGLLGRSTAAAVPPSDTGVVPTERDSAFLQTVRRLLDQVASDLPVGEGAAVPAFSSLRERHVMQLAVLRGPAVQKALAAGTISEIDQRTAQKSSIDALEGVNGQLEAMAADFEGEVDQLTAREPSTDALEGVNEQLEALAATLSEILGALGEGNRDDVDGMLTLIAAMLADGGRDDRFAASGEGADPLQLPVGKATENTLTLNHLAQLNPEARARLAALLTDASKQGEVPLSPQAKALVAALQNREAPTDTPLTTPAHRNAGDPSQSALTSASLLNTAKHPPEKGMAAAFAGAPGDRNHAQDMRSSTQGDTATGTSRILEATSLWDIRPMRGTPAAAGTDESLRSPRDVNARPAPDTPTQTAEADTSPAADEKPAAKASRIQATVEMTGRTTAAESLKSESMPDASARVSFPGEPSPLNRTPAAPTPSAPTPGAGDADLPKSIMDQLVEKAVLRSTGDRSEMRIQLKPDTLGDVRMRIVSENSHLTVRMIAENPAVKEIIETHLHHLKAELDRQGISVEKIEVLVNADDQQQHQREQFFQMSKHGSQQQGRKTPGDQDPDARRRPSPDNDDEPTESSEDGINYFA